MPVGQLSPGSTSQGPVTTQCTPPACKAPWGCLLLPPASCWERVPWQKDKLPPHSKQAAVTHPTAWGAPKGISESLKKDGERGSNSKEIRWNNSTSTASIHWPEKLPPTPCRQGTGSSQKGAGWKSRASQGTGLPNPSNLLIQ